jgi:hypothetical protein
MRLLELLFGADAVEEALRPREWERAAHVAGPNGLRDAFVKLPAIGLIRYVGDGRYAVIPRDDLPDELKDVRDALQSLLAALRRIPLA